MITQKIVRLSPTTSSISLPEGDDDTLSVKIRAETASSPALNTASFNTGQLVAYWLRNADSKLICVWKREDEAAFAEGRLQTRNPALSSAVIIAWTKWRRT